MPPCDSWLPNTESQGLQQYKRSSNSTGVDKLTHKTLFQYNDTVTKRFLVAICYANLMDMVAIVDRLAFRSGSGRLCSVDIVAICR